MYKHKIKVNINHDYYIYASTFRQKDIVEMEFCSENEIEEDVAIIYAIASWIFWSDKKNCHLGTIKIKEYEIVEYEVAITDEDSAPILLVQGKPREVMVKKEEKMLEILNKRFQQILILTRKSQKNPNEKELLKEIIDRADYFRPKNKYFLFC